MTRYKQFCLSVTERDLNLIREYCDKNHYVISKFIVNNIKKIIKDDAKFPIEEKKTFTLFGR